MINISHCNQCSICVVEHHICEEVTEISQTNLHLKKIKRFFNKVKQRDNHPVKVCLLQEKNNLTYNLRGKSCHRPKINTECYKNTFVNRLIFKYNLL